MSAQDSQPFHWHYTDLDDRSFQIRGRTLFFTIILFSLVLLVLLLFLYARWICRFHSLPSSLPTTTTSHAPPAPPPPQPRGLDPAAINALPVLLHRPLEGTECCICLAVFEDGEKVKVLPQCRHCYHCECVDRWLTTQSSCPLCRASLRVDSELPPSMSVVTE